MNLSKEQAVVAMVGVGAIALVLVRAAWRRTGANRRRVPVKPFEEHPYWEIPEVVVTSVSPDKERVDPDCQVTFTATLVNRGQGRAHRVQADVFLDGDAIFRDNVPGLGPGGDTTVQATWRAVGPGRHSVRATAAVVDENIRRSARDNAAECTIWVTGETDPRPELRVTTVDFCTFPLPAGGSAVIPVSVRNPSLAETSEMPIRFYIDAKLHLEDVVHRLRAGEQQEFSVRVDHLRRGQHLFRVETGAPGEAPAALPPPKGIAQWGVSIPGPSPLYSYPAGKDEWASLGPAILSDGNAGRMEDLAFDPQSRNTAYAVSEVGGIWKTTDWGNSWKPMGDKLPTLNFVRVAVDPLYPYIVYAATRWEGIWKSTDAGNNWSPFATLKFGDLGMADVRALVVRHRAGESGDQVVIYVACDAGVLRYASDDPWSLQSQHSEWSCILNEPVWDLAVHPSNSSILWASVNHWVVDPTGKYQVFDRVVAKLGPTSTWIPAQGLPNQGLVKIDVSQSTAKVLFASVHSPASGKELAIYRSIDDGLGWSLVCDFPANNGDYWKVMYNPFIRIDPRNSLIVYVAGTRLYRVDVNKALYGGSDYTRVIDAGHPDIKRLVFVGGSFLGGQAFWVLSDGGIWHVASPSSKVHRNNELRTVQLLDLASSATDSNLMLAGTQDNETIRYRGKPIWDVIGPEGDGRYSLISPTNPSRMYAQAQYLDSTSRTGNGLDAKPGWQAASGSGANRLPDVTDGFITIDPSNGEHLLAVGDQVRETTDAGNNWQPVGPVANVGQAPVRGAITRVIFRPGIDSHTWMAGTDQGEIWYHTKAGWIGVFEHRGPTGVPDVAPVVSMAFAPTDNRILYVLFDSSTQDARVYRLDLKGFNWVGQPISKYLPLNVKPRVICGDAFLNTLVYIGTDHGVYRGEVTPSGVDYTWSPYNDGLPLAEVTALVIDRISAELRAGTNGRGAWSVRTHA